MIKSLEQVPPQFKSLTQAREYVLKSLQKVPISSVIDHRRRKFARPAPELVAVHSSATLKEVLDILAHHSILAVPIYVTPEEKDDNSYDIGVLGGKEFIGIVSIYDILGWTVFQQVFDLME